VAKLIAEHSDAAREFEVAISEAPKFNNEQEHPPASDRAAFMHQNTMKRSGHKSILSDSSNACPTF
jgi:hypothetical protein